MLGLHKTSIRDGANYAAVNVKQVTHRAKSRVVIYTRLPVDTRDSFIRESPLILTKTLLVYQIKRIPRRCY